MTKSRITITLALIFFTAGCATVYNPATKREESVFITTEQEVGIGKKVEVSVLQKYKLSEDRAYKDKLERIGKEIALHSDRDDLEYYFKVVESKDVNAFALPGGGIFATTALLDAIDNDDELASVVGHEIGHTAARHQAKRIESQLGYSFLVNIAYLLDGRSPDVKNKAWEDIRMATNITFNLITLGYGRKDEILADRLGVIYAERAGYDPNGAISFLEKLA